MQWLTTFPPSLRRSGVGVHFDGRHSLLSLIHSPEVVRGDTGTGEGSNRNRQMKNFIISQKKLDYDRPHSHRMIFERAKSFLFAPPGRFKLHTAYISYRCAPFFPRASLLSSTHLIPLCFAHWQILVIFFPELSYAYICVFVYKTKSNFFIVSCTFLICSPSQISQSQSAAHRSMSQNTISMHTFHPIFFCVTQTFSFSWSVFSNSWAGHSARQLTSSFDIRLCFFIARK